MNILDKIKKEVSDEIVKEVSAPLKEKITQVIKLKKILRRIQEEIKLLIEDSELDVKESSDIFNEFVSFEDEKQ